MSIPYRTRRRLSRLGMIALILALIFALAWLCWVIWLERYIVYTDDGAKLDFSISAQELVGEVAVPPVAEEKIGIYYNEGADALDLSNSLTQLNGYYIDINMMQKDMAAIWEDIKILPSGTPIMIDMKGGYGSFFYSSNLDNALHSQSVAVAAVDELVKELQKRGFYTIARISAFRDYNFGLNHVPCGLYMLSRAGLWPDDGGCYWLDPTNSTTISWVTSIVLELKGIGFNEVLLTDFKFPNSDQYIFNGDMTEALSAAANKLVNTCATESFALSFCVDDPAFALPDGRCRMYLEGINAANVGATASKVTIPDPTIRLVFIAATNDTRFNSYGVMRSLEVAEILEAQKADQAD